MLITYTQNLSDEVGVFPSSGSSPVMMTCQEIMAQAPSGFNAFVATKASYGGGYAGFIIFFNISGDTIYLGDLEYILGRTDSEKYSAGIGASANVNVDTGVYRVQSANTRTLVRLTNLSWTVATKDNIQYRYQTYDSNHNIGNIIYFPSSVTNIYENGQPLITYQWTSVPAISGKNGILSLSTIKSAYINDGEPVTGATASNFDALTEETNVGTLVNDTSVDESKVVVRYNIPDGTYQYIKLVYKPNSEPETVSDGVVINIPQVDSQVVIDDIITTGTYYFKIFTNAGNSNTVVLNYIGIVPIIINIERVW